MKQARLLHIIAARPNYKAALREPLKTVEITIQYGVQGLP